MGRRWDAPSRLGDRGTIRKNFPVADPGFPLGGGDNLIREGTNSRDAHVSKICASK